MKKNHEVVVFPGGEASIRDIEAGEAMHSTIGPWQEARLIHLGQSGFKDRLTQTSESPLVIYDIGLGIGANALAAIDARAELAARLGPDLPLRKLKIVSFENDLGGIRLALANSEKFAFLAENREKAVELLRAGTWQEGAVTWDLREGDFYSMDLSREPKAEIVFFDFFSPKTHPALWSVAVFSKIQQACAPGAVLTTYSAATHARVALLLAGFQVGHGVSTAGKSETTVAGLPLSGELSSVKKPLGMEWLSKLGRSDKFAPWDFQSERREEILRRVSLLPQFTKSDSI